MTDNSKTFLNDPKRLAFFASMHRQTTDAAGLEAETAVEETSAMPLDLELKFRARELSGQLRDLDTKLTRKRADIQALRLLHAQTDDIVQLAAYSRLLDEYGADD